MGDETKAMATAKQASDCHSVEERGCYPWRSAFKKAVNVAATGGSGGGSSPAPPLAPAPVLPMAVAVSAIVVAVAVASSAAGWLVGPCCCDCTCCSSSIAAFSINHCGATTASQYVTHLTHKPGDKDEVRGGEMT